MIGSACEELRNCAVGTAVSESVLYLNLFCSPVGWLVKLQHSAACGSRRVLHHRNPWSVLPLVQSELV